MSYETEIMNKMQKGEATTDRLDIPLLKYLWEASPLSYKTKDSYHDFFKK